MKHYPGLDQRGKTGIWQARLIVPADCREVIGKSAFWQSLDTTSFDEALPRYRQCMTTWKGEIAAARRQLTARPVDDLDDRTVQHIAADFGVGLVGEDERTRLLGFLVGDMKQDAATRQRWTAAGGEPHHWRAYRGNLAFMLYMLKQDHGIGRVSDGLTKYTADTLAAQGIRLSPDSLALRKLALAMQAAAIEAIDNALARFEGGGASAEAFKAAKAPVLEPKPAASATEGPLLADEIAAYIAEKTAAKAWTGKTADAIKDECGWFLEVVGNKAVTAMTKADFRTYRDLLKKLPPHWTKRSELAGLSFTAAAEKAASLSLEPLSPANFNKRLGFIGSFWNYVSKRHDSVIHSPVGQMLEKRPKGMTAKDRRDPFPLRVLPFIFQAPLYTGCQSVSSWTKPGNKALRDSFMFWLPLLGLFSGMRLGEAAGLETADLIDIKRDGKAVGLCCYLFDRDLKTAAAKRVVPVHSEVMQCGFGQFVAMRRKRGDVRLFPDSPIGCDGTFSHTPSKWFNDRFLPSAGVRRKDGVVDDDQAKLNKLVFHSFRHNFEDAAKVAGMKPEIRDMFLGHASQAAEQMRTTAEAVMAGNYGSRNPFELWNLLDEMNKIRYDGLDVSHLHVDMQQLDSVKQL